MIEDLLASKVKVKILRFFFEYPLVRRSVREIALECKVGFGKASTSLKELNEIGILKKEKKGREIFYSLNPSSVFYSPLEKIFEIEKKMYGNLPFLFRNLFAHLSSSTRKFSKLCVVFGSLVSGTFTPESDVDLLFISDDEERIREICSRLEEKYGMRFQVIVIKEDDIEKFKKSSLYKTLQRESLILYGEEDLKKRLGL